MRGRFARDNNDTSTTSDQGARLDRADDRDVVLPGRGVRRVGGCAAPVCQRGAGGHCERYDAGGQQWCADDRAGQVERVADRLAVRRWSRMWRSTSSRCPAATHRAALQRGHGHGGDAHEDHAPVRWLWTAQIQYSTVTGRVDAGHGRERWNLAGSAARRWPGHPRGIAPRRWATRPRATGG